MSLNNIGHEIEPEIIYGLLQRVPLAAKQTAIIARGARIVSMRGCLTQLEALEVAAHVAKSRREAGQAQRVEFMQLRPAAASALLLVYPLCDGYRLILIENDGLSLVSLRKLSKQLLNALEVVGITADTL